MNFIKFNNYSVSESSWIFKGKTDYVDTWILMGTPYPVMIILASYIAFANKFGPQYMKNKSPYNVDNLVVAYNAAQILLSSFLMYRITSFIYRNGILHKECVTYSNEDEKYYFLCTAYCCMLSKLSELLDTIFFVLRKKQSQVTFLHVYHHTVMLGAVWVCLKYEPNENFVFGGMLNTGVHVIMYAYYALSVFPGLRQYLWWKKYITTMQLVQFLLVFIHLIASQFTSDCPPSTGLYYFALFNMLFLYYLFNNFYKDSYITKKNTKNFQDDLKDKVDNEDFHSNENTKKTR